MSSFTNPIVECLSATLSPDTNVRVSAELNLSQLLTSPDAALALAQLIHIHEAQFSLRQISIIVLRKYITEHWSPYFSTFKGAAPQPEAKDQIRKVLFAGLSDEDRRIRSLCAHALSSIAHCDWPDEYPELLSSLIGLLSSNEPNSVHGAMQVFTEFIKSDLTEDQILPVLRNLLPVLLSILGSSESHSAPTRARTVAVFRQCVMALFMVKYEHPDAVKEAIASVLPVWLDAFRAVLSTDPQTDVSATGNWDDLAVRIQVFKTFDKIQVSFPRSLNSYLSDFLSISLKHLENLYPTYHLYYLTAENAIPSSSEGGSIELPELICPILDFVGGIVRSAKFKSWFNSENLSRLISNGIMLSQMTNENEETWTTDANAFVAQEDDDTQSYCVRVAFADLLSCLISDAPATSVRLLQSSFQTVLGTAQRGRDAGDPDWWRPLEAALAVLGSQSESVIDCIEDEIASEREKPIDIEVLLTDVVPSILNLSEFPFLQGRGFVFASQYAQLLPPNLAGQYLDAAVQAVEAQETSVPVRVSAVKAIHNFCNIVQDAAILPYAPRIARDLGPFLLVTSEDTLTLVLEALSVVVGIQKGVWVTPEISIGLAQTVIEVWNRNNKDPIFLSILTDILTTLAACPTPGVYEAVVQQSLPALSNAIAHARPEESWITSSAIELVSSLVQGSPERGIGDGFFQLLAPNLFKCLGEADDRDVLQNGVSCLTDIIRKDCNQIIQWTDETGRNGLEYVLTLIAKTLESQDESSGLTIGNLIIHLLRRAGEAILPVLPQLLQAMVARMVDAKTATFIQSLVIPFAFLINNQRDTVLDLLESITIQDRSALNILIQTWCENDETFQGFWPSRISTMGLATLFASERPSLRELNVKGDIIVKPEQQDVIMTRSKTKKTPFEFTSIPFHLKALKLILHDIQFGDESTAIAAATNQGFDVDSDDGDDEWAEEGKVMDKKQEEEFAFLSEMLGPKGIPFDNDEVLQDNDDDDLRQDPVSQIDLPAHFKTFFQECAARNTNAFTMLVDQLSVEETIVIRRLLGAQ